MKKNMLAIIRATSIVATVFMLVACVGTAEKTDTAGAHRYALNSSQVSSEVNLANIQAHMSFLADDLLEGRDTGSKGHEIASLYIAKEFEKYGLEPAGENGSFMQRVTFRRTRLDQNSPSLQLVGKDDVEFSFPNDFIVTASQTNTESIASGELVFVGYGIVSEELGYDDYAAVDVAGKIVVALMGRPKDIPSDVGASISSNRYKRGLASERGAAGMLLIQTPTLEASRPYSRFLSFVQAPQMTWLGKDGKPRNAGESINASALLSIESATKLFAAAGKDLTEMFDEVADGAKPESFNLNLTLAMSYKSSHENVTSPNVVGMLAGSDPSLKDEYVVYTAHSDHIGVSQSVQEDRINNGAMDNASGTSILIETARMFSNLPTAPRRSILFVALTGEERGLLGADYFVKHPTVDGDMVANVNLDMPLLTFEFADVIAFGAKHSTMGKSVEQAVANANMKLTDDPWPELNLFTRSDHFAFVREGIPAVFLVSGVESRTEGIDGSTVLQTFLSTHYHSPTDDMNLPFVWSAALNFARVNFEIGHTLGNQDARPAWYKDSYFGQTFGKGELVERGE